MFRINSRCNPQIYLKELLKCQNTDMLVSLEVAKKFKNNIKNTDNSGIYGV